MEARILPVRCPPLPDELLSSWFVRLAHANGEKVQSLAFKMFGRQFQFVGGGDPDRARNHHVIATLAHAAGVPEQAVWEATLASYAGFLWDEIGTHGARRWIMPLVDRRSRRNAYGLQACPCCLRDDPIPYFRRAWRLTFQVVCPFHQCLLLDHCPGCEKPLMIHRGDIGVFTPLAESSVRWCSSCGADLSENAAATKIASEVVEFQMLLLRVLQRGWINVGGRVVHSVLFFEGLRMLWAFLDAQFWSSSMRHSLEHYGLCLAPAPAKRYGGVDVRRTDARYLLLAAAEWLLGEWPDRFLRIASRSGVSSNHILHFSLRGQAATPFWLWEPVHLVLDHAMYVPTEQEIRNTYRYLIHHGGKVRHRDVCWMLNMKTNHSSRVASVLAKMNK